MVSWSTQNYSSLKKSTWPHLLLVGQFDQTWSNLLKTCFIWYGSLQKHLTKYLAKIFLSFLFIPVEGNHKKKTDEIF